MRIVFTLTLFLSSFLLFLVQPLAGKMILPTFGGAPAVWNASLVFFQLALLVGYGYAHLSLKWLGPKRQFWVHLPLMALALAALPFTINTVAFGFFRAQAAAGFANPSLLVVGALAVIVGLPFVIVSAGAPVIQRWFGFTDDPAAKDPYFLYGASNLGSMLALLAYPFAVEPNLRLAEQSGLWQGLYAALVIGMAICAALMIRRLAPELPRNDPDETSLAEAGAPPQPSVWRQRGLWILLAAVPSSLLSGVTTYASTNLAPIPLLWVIPLAAYLLTFTLAFTNRPVINTRILSRALPLFLIPLIVLIAMDEGRPEMAVVHITAFFVAAWMCHSRLYDARPSVERLTEFYFFVSVGGVIGGAMNGLLAPTIFNDLWEYPLAIALAGALKLPYREDQGPKPLDLVYAAVVLAITVGLVIAVSRVPALSDLPQHYRTLVKILVPAVLVFVASDHPLRFGLSTAAILFGTMVAGSNSSGRIIHQERSFFGVHKVIDSGVFHRMVHGNTLHGMQDTTAPSRPLTYYYPTGPIGNIFTKMGNLPVMDNVALVGLGVGSLAAYGRPGQNMTFYEIDPTVVTMAQNPKLFTFTRDSKADINYVLGDARLTLEKAPDGRYGLIALDAFSSDAIPIHLLTREAIAMYMRKLRPNGILALHISNRYLELEPVVSAAAADLGLKSWVNVDSPTDEEAGRGKTASQWMVIARKKEDAAPILGIPRIWSDTEPTPGIRAWTDDYSNVLSVFRREM